VEPRRLLELLAPSVCPACDAPRRAGEPLLCPACARGVEPLPGLGEAATAIAYRGTGALLVRRFKYDGRRDAGVVLLEALVERARPIRFDVVVPVPRHPRRIRALGADPVYDLSRALAARTGTRFGGRVLRRARPTASQTGLGPEERERNVSGSFRARPGALLGRAALLLDDVTTTGATLRAGAAELLGAGRARTVATAALAGTPLAAAPLDRL
jgi:predicted amidophosphoribosyltransferase